MKLNKIHKDLKELYNERGTVKLIFGAVFEHENEVERCMKIFQSGFWSVAPFAFESYDTYGIRLNPKKSVKESSVVLGDDEGFLTVSHNLSGFIPFRQLKMLKNPKFIKYIIDDWDLLEELSHHFREYTEDFDSLVYLKEYLQNNEKLKYLENPSEHYSTVYLDFWNHYNNTSEQKEYTELMIAMEKDKTFLPDFQVRDYGVWSTRAYNAMAQRAYSKVSHDTVTNYESYNFHSFIQPHGFDSVEYTFDILPSASKSINTLSGIIAFFDTNPDLKWEYSKHIKEHPLFKVAEALRENKRNYKGDAHIAAAKILDEELGDPVMAWNALVTAGYWSGVNFKDPNMEAWNAAINLSHKHGWTEINEILTDQLEFYNYYKDKI